MSKIIARMLPQDQAEYDKALANAPQPVLYLARTLQRAAFPDKEFDGGFRPAPIYLKQAVTLAGDPELRSRLLEAFSDARASSVKVLS
ncbi:hypothetical protein EVC02_010 [Rhizobium phage RHph_N17]|nr:hypothetical protein EVC02_010 [Rhizobium phage RHph_N17]